MNKTTNHEQKNGLLTEADQIALSEMLSDLPARLSEDDKAAFRDMAGNDRQRARNGAATSRRSDHGDPVSDPDRHDNRRPPRQ